jgi:hypothetical protein
LISQQLSICLAAVCLHLTPSKPDTDKPTGLVLDGSFRLPASALEDEAGKTLVLDYAKDPGFHEGGPLEFVTLISPEGIKQLMRMGYCYAKQLHEEGKLGMLQPIARDRFGHDEWVHQPRASSQPAGVGGGGQSGIDTIYSGVGAAAAAEAEGIASSGNGSDSGGAELRARL